MAKRLYLLVALLLLGSGCLSAQFFASVDTFPQWDGALSISSFGVTNTATYGQTITVSPNAGPLLRFAFQIGNCNAAVSFRGHVYAFDGTKATGPSLFDSAVQSVPADAAFHLVTFNTGNLVLLPGVYVLFASTSEDQGGAQASACRWGAIPSDTFYTGGQFKYINNGPNPAQWTTTTWSFINEDLAFQALFNTPVPTLSEWGMILLACLLVGTGYFILRSRSRLRLSTE